MCFVKQCSSTCLALPWQVPFLFKYAVDALTADPTGATAASVPLLTLMPATLLLGYGAARAGSALFNELRNAVFAKVMLGPACMSDQCLSCCCLNGVQVELPVLLLNKLQDAVMALVKLYMHCAHCLCTTISLAFWPLAAPVQHSSLAGHWPWAGTISAEEVSVDIGCQQLHLLLAALIASPPSPAACCLHQGWLG